ncbi:uncharacterized protein LOC116249994 [Nymphaea colorata]|uniref:uncharacterized protein LOC116249994 n=1 Tax=Nymphaea colorata TaxID=210225 RepID=UPI00129E23D8|nr:uncharacterized protein LOC116249994 [Nymphaea colorata]
MLTTLHRKSKILLARKMVKHRTISPSSLQQNTWIGFWCAMHDLQVINLANAPSVVGKHLDDECPEDFIKGLILFVSSFFHVERRFAEPLDASPSLPYLIFWNPAKFLPLFYEAAHMAQEVCLKHAKLQGDGVEESLHMTWLCGWFSMECSSIPSHACCIEALLVKFSLD